jgi:hypothetical protein
MRSMRWAAVYEVDEVGREVMSLNYCLSNIVDNIAHTALLLRVLLC